MKKQYFAPTALAIAISSILLVGCGGGGGVQTNPDVTPIPTPIPTPTPTPTPTPDTDKIKVGVIDSGANAKSQYLKDQVSKVIKFTENGDVITATDITNQSADKLDTSNSSHGTFVSEIIAGNGVKGSTVGAANGIADIYAAQTTINAQAGGYSHINFNAMAQLQEKYGVNLFNGSFGASGTEGTGFIDASSSAYSDAQKVVDNNGLIILATGNTGDDRPSLESYMPIIKKELEKGFLVVTGLNADKTGLYRDSQGLGANACGDAGRWCLAADYINGPLGLEKDGDTANYLFHGTSGAAPQVTAQAVLIWNKYPWMTAEQVRQTILTTADYMDDGSGLSQYYNSTYGWGYFNTESALKGPALFDTMFGDKFNADLGLGHNSTFASDISGNGGLFKTGSGVLVLSGNNTYTGNTLVDAGNLQVDGSLTSDTVVDTFGKLTGSGLVGNVLNKGTVSTESGALTVDGDFTQEASGRYIYGLGNTLKVTGKADIKGSLEVYAKDQKIITKGDHTVLTANGGVFGQFGDYASISPFLKLIAVSYDNNAVYAKIDFADSALAGTVKGGISDAAGALTNQLMEKANNEFLLTGQDSNLTKYIAGLQSVQTQEAAQAVLNSNSGAMFVESPSVLLRNESVISSQIARRSHAVSKNGRSGVWGTTSYSENTLNADDWNSVDSSIYVNTIGADTTFGLGDQNVIGGYVSSFKADSDFNQLDGQSKLDLISLGLYGKVSTDLGFYAAANAHYGKGENEFKRNIFTGVESVESRVDADMESIGAYTELGYVLGTGYIWSLTPYFGLSYNSVDMDGITEGSEFGLVVGSTKADEAKAHAGFRFDYKLSHDLNVNGFAEYAYAFNRNLPDVLISSNLDRAISVGYQAPSFDKDYAFYGVGFDYTTPQQQWGVFGDVAGMTDDSNNYQVQLGLKYNF